MAIGMVEQRDGMLYAYDEKNNLLWGKSISGELYGYTSSIITIKDGNYTYTINERGDHLGGRYS